jgi:hypothetical protein
MWSYLQSVWDAGVNLFVLFVVLGIFWFCERSMKWKYVAGTKERDVGMLKMGVGVTRAFFGK